MKLRYNLDLALFAAISLLLIPAVVFTPVLAVRLALGVPFLLFAPGYALVAAFFPGRTRLSAAERITYAVVLSIALVMLDGLLLNYAWRIDVYPLLISLEGLTMVVLTIAWWRRGTLAEDERMTFNQAKPGPKLALMDKLLAMMLVLVIIGACGTAVYAGIKNTQPYSEFYLLGSAGKAADYPQNLAVGQQGQLTLVSTNHEKQTVSYTVKINQEDGQTSVNGSQQSEINFTLTNGQQQNYTVSFSFDTAGAGQKLEFNLYKSGSTEVYLRTYLRVDVS